MDRRYLEEGKQKDEREQGWARQFRAAMRKQLFSIRKLLVLFSRTHSPVGI